MRAFVFDADGVLTIPQELFSQVYAKRYGLPIEPFEQFFKEQFPAALIGKADLKELIANNRDVWPHGTPDEIIKDWCEGEDLRNSQTIAVVEELKRRGERCYLATNQEKYRGDYMKDVMFHGLFDAYFVSGEMGFMKPEAAFFELVLQKIQRDVPGIQPQDVIFFDDTPGHVEGARQLGIDARLYENIDQLRSLL